MASATQSGGGNAESPETLRVRNRNLNLASNVKLSSKQELLVGSVLDAVQLFEGHPTLGKLSLWDPQATFKDPIALAQGYDRFAAQWYGLPALFNPIKIQSHRVASAGNPIEVELSNKYTIRGIKAERVIDSVVRIHVDAAGKIEAVEDRWNNELPEGGVSETFRKLSATVTPTFVSVPKTEEADRKMEADRAD